MYFKEYILSSKLSLTKIINGLFYFLHSIPFVGKIFGDHYRLKGLKKFVYFFYPIFTLIKDMINHALVILIMSVAMTGFTEGMGRLFGKEDLMIYRSIAFLVIHLFFALSMNSALSNATKFEEMVKIMGLNPKAHLIHEAIYDPLFNIIPKSIVFFLYGTFILQVNGFFLVAWGIAFSLISMTTAYWQTKYYYKTKKELGNSWTFVIMLLVAGLAIAVLLSYLSFDLVFIGWIVALIFLFPAFKAYQYFLNLKDFGLIYENQMEKLSSVEKYIKKREEGNITFDSEDKGKGRGFDRLNYLFFRRHKKAILKPILIKSGLAFLLGVSLIVLSYRLEIKAEDVNEFKNVVPFVLPFIMYMFCYQNNIATLMYNNLDKSLFIYPFYRQSASLLTMFFLRAKTLFFYSLLPTTIVAASIFFLEIRLGLGSISKWMILLVYLYGFFFSLYPFFIYYLFQPQLVGGTRGKIGGFFSILPYLASFFILPRLIDVIEVETFVYFSIGFLVVFLLASILLIYKFGPKAIRKK